MDDVWKEILVGLEKQQTLYFPYDDYDIVGDTGAISRILQSHGRVYISAEDIAHTLSRKTVNYVSVGSACGKGGLVTAFRDAVNKLPVALETVSKLLLYSWISADFDCQETDWADLSNYVDEVFPVLEVCWGWACDEALNHGQVKMVLVAAGN